MPTEQQNFQLNQQESSTKEKKIKKTKMQNYQQNDQEFNDDKHNLQNLDYDKDQISGSDQDKKENQKVKQNLNQLQFLNLDFCERYQQQQVTQQNCKNLDMANVNNEQYSYSNNYNQIESYNQADDVFSSQQDQRLKRVSKTSSKRSSQDHIQIQDQALKGIDEIKQINSNSNNQLIATLDQEQQKLVNDLQKEKDLQFQSANKLKQKIIVDQYKEDLGCRFNSEKNNQNQIKLKVKDKLLPFQVQTPKKQAKENSLNNSENKNIQNKLTWSNQAQSSPISNISPQRYVQKPPQILLRLNQNNFKNLKNDNDANNSYIGQKFYKGFANNDNQEQTNITLSQVDLKEKQKSYQKQMEDDMQMLKKSMNSKNNKKTKMNLIDTQKNKLPTNLNKTHMPSPNTTISSKFYLSKKQDDDSLSKNQDLRMLLKISLEKKKQNYQLLKQWDKKRAENMALHRNMIEMMQNQIDKKIKSSLQNFEIYTTFFREKVKQQQKFVNSHVLNTKYALQNNSISKNIYINCSVILNSLSEQNSNRAKKVSDFANLLKSNILNGLMDIHLHESQKELLKIREKISTLKSSLKKYNTQTEQKTQSLTLFFTQNATSLINTSTKSQNDFYFQQLQFLRCASQQILIQKKLGQNCLQYYHTALSEQKKRANVIKQAMITYAKGLKQAYKTQIQSAEIEQMSKNQQMKLIEQYYSLEQMFDERNLKLFRYKLQQLNNSSVSSQINNSINSTKNAQNQVSDDINIQNFTAYIESFNYHNFNSRMLLLKQFNAFYYTPISASLKQSVKNNNMREQTCYIAITVDCFLHLFFSIEKTGSHPKPDVTLKIHNKQIQLKEIQKSGSLNNNQCIDIVKKQERRSSMISYFWQSKGNDKSYRIKFRNKDVKQQFCDYIKKLM